MYITKTCMVTDSWLQRYRWIKTVADNEQELSVVRETLSLKVYFIKKEKSPRRSRKTKKWSIIHSDWKNNYCCAILINNAMV